MCSLYHPAPSPLSKSMQNNGKICRRCLLEEIGEAELLRSLEELKNAMSEEERAEDSEYARRLGICKECDELNNGTCMKCGCYVEFRALKKRMRCPHEKTKW